MRGYFKEVVLSLGSLDSQEPHRWCVCVWEEGADPLKLNRKVCTDRSFIGERACDSLESEIRKKLITTFFVLFFFSFFMVVKYT